MTAVKAVMAAQQGLVCRCFKKWIVITAQAARRKCVFRTYFVSALYTLRHGIFQFLQIRFVGVGNSSIKVFNHVVNVWDRQRAVFHLYIALPHRLRHFPLAHVGADDSIGSTEVLLNGRKNFVKIFLTAAEPGCAKQEHLFALERFQKIGDFLIAAPLVRPKADEKTLCLQSLL